MSTADNSPSADPSRRLTSNQPVSPLQGGLDAEQWRQDLTNFKPGQALPDPRTPTGDKAIDTLANAAGQQNATYAWGGNKDKNGASVGQPDDGQGANQNHDWDRMGYDCGGLVRFAVFQATGKDVGMGTNAIDTSSALSQVQGGVAGNQIAQFAQPGDILIFGGNAAGPFSGVGTTHTGIYIGKGLMMNAPDSGHPVRVDSVLGHGVTDILRVKP